MCLCLSVFVHVRACVYMHVCVHLCVLACSRVCVHVPMCGYYRVLNSWSVPIQIKGITMDCEGQLLSPFLQASCTARADPSCTGCFKDNCRGLGFFPSPLSFIQNDFFH